MNAQAESRGLFFKLTHYRNAGQFDNDLRIVVLERKWIRIEVAYSQKGNPV